MERGWLENLLTALFVSRKSLISSKRGDVIRMIIKLPPPDARILEIGTYFAKGSTKIFIDGLSNQASLFLMDIWASYVSTNDKAKGSSYRIIDSISYFACTNTLRVIREAQKRNDCPSITMIRRSTDDSYLADNFFDLVFIDGSHYYQDVSKDIKLALRILKPGGIISGDDLEILPSSSLAAVAKEHLREDYVPYTEGSNFHPGVALAVYELLGSVNMKDGIWWKVIQK